MIIDYIDKLTDYTTLNPLFATAIEYIQSLDFNTLQEGKIELDGKNLFVIISNSPLKMAKDAKLEVHNQYIDIQIPVSKRERFGWSPRVLLKESIGEFDTTKDIQFFNDSYSTEFDLKPGNFVIFFPQDAHAPCIGEGSVTKIIIKVKIKP